jgi:hypothetical protein
MTEFKQYRRKPTWMAQTYTVVTNADGSPVVLERRGKAGEHGDAWREVNGPVRDRVLAGLSRECVR